MVQTTRVNPLSYSGEPARRGTIRQRSTKKEKQLNGETRNRLKEQPIQSAKCGIEFFLITSNCCQTFLMSN